MSEVPETHVLAVASHVAYGYVGNTMATFVMQALGCEVTAINTVQFSNHTGYKQFKGRKTEAGEIAELYEGLKQSRLNDFDVLLSGYCPSAAVVQQVGKIARETRFNTTTKPGSFFWVLDPVMGDEGRIYVSEDVVPAYKSLLKDADLILPNQFEAELLSGIKITDFKSLGEAVRELHRVHRVPHVIITSVRLPHDDGTPAELSIVGSTADSNFNPRLFRLNVPAFPVFFSGTGDMFAALMVARLREACHVADVLSKAHWQSPDEVPAVELPLAKAAEKVLASMHMVLKKTMESRQVELQQVEEEDKHELNAGIGARAIKDKERERHLRLTKAAEVRVVKNWRDLVEPIDVDALKAHPVHVELDANPQVKADELGVVNMGTGNEIGQGAVYQT